MKFPTRIPTLIGILLLVGVVGGIIYSVEKVFRTDTKASGSREPKQIRATNISDSSLTVSWTTEIPTTGTLLLESKGKSNKVYFDERDQAGKLGTYLAHSVTVRGLIPDSDYLVTPLVNGKPHVLADTPMTVRLASPLPLNTGGLEPAYGTIQNEDGTPNGDSIVYLSIEGGQEMSAISKPSGSWIIPLNQARTQDLSSYLPVIERMNESIQIYSGIQQATVSTDSLNDSPVPEVMLGQDYDFKRQQAKKSNSVATALRPITPSPSPIVTRAQIAAVPTKNNVLGDTTQKAYTVSITEPKNNSSISSTLPFITGTGVPGKYIGISVGLTNPTHGSVQVASNGIWTYTPKQNLAPGKQSVTISSVDTKGKAVAVTHMFSVFKSGTQVLGDATPSATLTPGDTITSTPIVDETPTPDSTLAGTPPPISGNELPTLILLILGFGLIAGGSVVFLR